MTPGVVLTVVGWLILAGYVMWRCFTSTRPVSYDILFAAWLGGVQSLAVVWAVLHWRRRQATA